MSEEKKLNEQESLELIPAMIQKVKNSCHDTGIGSLLCGRFVFIASFVSFLRYRYNFTIGIDIWLLILGAIITYFLFIFSCFTESQYDILLGAIAAIVCWFIPGIILRKKYVAQKKSNV